MKINIDTVVTDMLSAMKEVFSGGWKKVEPVVRQFVRNRKKRLEMLAEFYLNGEITQQELEQRLKEERTVFGAELEALKVASKALTQKAANRAIDVLSNAIKVLC